LYSIGFQFLFARPFSFSKIEISKKIVQITGSIDNSKTEDFNNVHPRNILQPHNKLHDQLQLSQPITSLLLIPTPHTHNSLPIMVPSISSTVSTPQQHPSSSSAVSLLLSDSTNKGFSDSANKDFSDSTIGDFSGLTDSTIRESSGSTNNNGPTNNDFHMISRILKLSTGDHLPSWTIAENHIKDFGKQKGFVVIRYRVEYHKTQLSNSTERDVKKRTYVCEFFGQYKPNKTKPIELQRNRGSKKTGCEWHVNLCKLKNGDIMRVTSIHPHHNHELLADNARFATLFRRFDHSIMEEIERAVIYGRCDAYTIRNLLQPLFPD